MITLKQLVEAEADLIRKAAKERLRSEFEAQSGYRTAAPNLEQEISLSEAKDMLAKKGYPQQSIDSVLGQYESLPQDSLGITLNRAVEIAKYYSPEEKKKREEQAIRKTTKKEAKSLYYGMRETRKFMLKYIKGTDIRLEFPSQIDGHNAGVTVTGCKYSARVYVNAPGFSYDIDFIGTFIDEDSRRDWLWFLFPILGQTALPIKAYMWYREQPYSLSIIKEALASDKTSVEIKKFRHIVQLKDETEQALTQKAKGLLSENEPKKLDEKQTKLLTASK